MNAVQIFAVEAIQNNNMYTVADTKLETPKTHSVLKNLMNRNERDRKREREWERHYWDSALSIDKQYYLINQLI